MFEPSTVVSDVVFSQGLSPQEELDTCVFVFDSRFESRMPGCLLKTSQVEKKNEVLISTFLGPQVSYFF